MSNREFSSWGVKLSAVALLLSVFAAGAVSGALFYRWAHLDGDAERGPMPPGDLGRMLRELDLTAEQQAQAKTVFERHRPKLDSVLRETFPKVRAVQDEIDADLQRLLTPAQVLKFTELRKRRPPPGTPMGPGRFGPPGMPPPPSPFAPPIPSDQAPAPAPSAVPQAE